MVTDPKVLKFCRDELFKRIFAMETEVPKEMKDIKSKQSHCFDFMRLTVKAVPSFDVIELHATVSGMRAVVVDTSASESEENKYEILINVIGDNNA